MIHIYCRTINKKYKIAIQHYGYGKNKKTPEYLYNEEQRKSGKAAAKAFANIQMSKEIPEKVEVILLDVENTQNYSKGLSKTNCSKNSKNSLLNHSSEMIQEKMIFKPVDFDEIQPFRKSNVPLFLESSSDLNVDLSLSHTLKKVSKLAIEGNEQFMKGKTTPMPSSKTDSLAETTGKNKIEESQQQIFTNGCGFEGNLSAEDESNEPKPVEVENHTESTISSKSPTFFSTCLATSKFEAENRHLANPNENSELIMPGRFLDEHENQSPTTEILSNKGLSQAQSFNTFTGSNNKDIDVSEDSSNLFAPIDIAEIEHSCAEAEQKSDCKFCLKLQKDFNTLKIRSEVNFKLLKQKIITTSELITKYHRKCEEFEKLRNEAQDVQARLDGAYREAANLRIQLEKALQANDPLKKVLFKLENEKSIFQRKQEELEKNLDISKSEVSNLKNDRDSSRIMQTKITKEKEEIIKHHEKEKKKVIHQAKIIDKLSSKLKQARGKSKEDVKNLKKARKEIEILLAKIRRFSKPKDEKESRKKKGKSSKKSQDSSLPSNLPLSSSPEINDEMVVPPVQALDEEDSGLLKMGTKRNSQNTLNSLAFNESRDTAVQHESSISDEFTSKWTKTDLELSADIEKYLNQIFNQLKLSSHKWTHSPPLLSPPLSPLPPSPLHFANESIQTSLSWVKERNDDNRISNEYCSDEDTDSKIDEDLIHSNILPSEVRDSVSPENGLVEDSRKNYKDSNLNEHSKSIDSSLVEEGCEPRNECIKQQEFMEGSQNVCEFSSDKNKINHDNDQTSEKQEKPDQSNVIVNQTLRLSDKEIIHSAKISSLENMESSQNIDKDNHVRSYKKQSNTGLVTNSAGNGINIPYSMSSVSRKEKSECFCNTQGNNPSKNTGFVKVSEKLLVTEPTSKLPCQNSHISTAEINSQMLVKKGEMEAKNVAWLPTGKGNESFTNIENQVPNENCKIQNWEKPCIMTRENEGNNSEKNCIHLPGHKEEIKLTGDGKRSENSLKTCKLLYEKNLNEFQREGNNQTRPSNPDSIRKDSEVTDKISNKDQCPNKNDSNSSHSDEESNRRNDFVDILTGKVEGTAETEIETTDKEKDYLGKNAENDLTLQSSKCHSQTNGAFTNNNELNIEISESENKLNAKRDTCCKSSEKNEKNSNVDISVSTLDNFEIRDHHNQVKSKKDSNSGESRVQLNFDQPLEKDSGEQENAKETKPDEKASHASLLSRETELPSLPCVSIDREDQINKSVGNDQSVSDSLLIISPKMFSPKQGSSCENSSNERQFHAVSRVEKEEKLQNLLTVSGNGKNMKAGNFDTTETGMSKSTAKNSHILVVPKGNMKNSSTLRQVDVQSTVRNKSSKSKLKQQFSPGVPFSDSDSGERCCNEMNNIAVKKEDNLDENDSEVAFLNMVSKKVNTLKHSENNRRNEILTTLEPTQKTVSFVSHISNMHKKPNASRRIPRAKIINRRHTIAVGNPTNSVRSPLKRAARTKSFSPSIFLSPSPPLSPIPPSPHRSALTPIISPLPTTPLPESVSPLPPSPKITSPPLIRGMALHHSENLSIHVPKPVVPSERLKAVKAITFQKKFGDLPIIMSPELQANRSSSSVADNFKNLKNVAHVKSLSRPNSLKRNAECPVTPHQPKPKSTKKISFLEHPKKVNILKENLERESLTTALNRERLQEENDFINSTTTKKTEPQMLMLDCQKAEFQNCISSNIPFKDPHDIKIKNLEENASGDISDFAIEQKGGIRHKVKSEKSSYSTLENEASSAVTSLVENNINLSSQAHRDNKEEYKLVDTSKKEVSEVLDRDSQSPSKYPNRSKTLNPASLFAEAKEGIIKRKSGIGIHCKSSTLNAHNYTEGNAHDEISAHKVSYTNLQKQPTQKNVKVIDSNENNEKEVTTCGETNDNRDISFTEVIKNSEDSCFSSLSLREKNQVEKDQIDTLIDNPRNDSSETVNNPKAKHTQGKLPVEKTNDGFGKQNRTKQIKNMDPDIKSAATGLGRKKESPSNRIMNKNLYKNTKFIVKKLFKVSSSNRILNKKRILTSILSKESNIDISAICNAIIKLIQKYSEIPEVLKSIEQNCNFNRASQAKLDCKCMTQAANGLPNTQSNLHNNVFSSPCQNCQKLRGATWNNKTKHVFNTCGNLSFQPVLTGLEHDLLIIARKLYADQRFRRKLQTMLLKRIKELLKSYTKLITVERLALCRFYVACCRLTGNLDEVIAYMYGVFYDPVPINLSTFFITFYTTWPAVISRLDLIKVNSDQSLDLTRVKLSPLSATFELIAFVEAYRKKEVSSLKVLEFIFQIQLESDTPTLSYYQPMLLELFRCLCNSELSFIQKTAGGETVFCPFVFSTIKSIELLCKRVSFEWVYNIIILEYIWTVLRDWTDQKNCIKTDTVAIVLKLIVPEAIQLAACYTVLDLSPCNPEECYKALNSWFVLREKQFSIPVKLRKYYLELSFQVEMRKKLLLNNELRS